MVVRRRMRSRRSATTGPRPWWTRSLTHEHSSRVDPSRVGFLGFSLGGHLCLRARAAAKPKALVEYFAPMFDGIGLRGSVPHAQIDHGTKDEFPATDFSNAGAIESILALEGPDVTFFPYEGATHGFAGQDAANANAAVLSKTRTLTFFGTCLS